MTKGLITRTCSFLFLIFLLGPSVKAQTIPELVFQNPVLTSGTAGADGASYLFPNVGPGLDAVITIISRSDASVVLGSIDTIGAGLGYTKSFQPVIGLLGTAPANTTWWMKFNCTFYDAGTSNKKMMSTFNVTGLDIDGDGSTLFEWAQMDRISNIDSAIVNSLTFTMVNNYGAEKDYKISGIIANSPGIDTSALNVMATYTYLNKDNFDFTIGATTSGLTTSAGMRLNSLWFKQFSWAHLPVKLMSFSAILNQDKVELNWKTASEINASHFVIEKSTDGRNFSEAGIVFARDNETDVTGYSFSDRVPEGQTGIMYYRLRSVDIDGRSEYSTIRIIRFAAVKTNDLTILTYPNPVAGELRITVPENWQQRPLVYEIFTMDGQLMKRKQTPSSGQTETIDMNRLSRGIYIIKVSCEGVTTIQRIVKQ